MRIKFCRMLFDALSKDQVLGELSRQDSSGFRYVVTPNVDHLQRAFNQPELHKIYSDSSICINDSKVLQLIARVFAIDLKAFPGSEMTEAVFSQIVQGSDRLLVIGSDNASIEKLRDRYQLDKLDHYDPPMGLAQKPEEIKKCAEQALRHQYRFIFLAVGSPAQELIANEINRSDGASGVALCIGASIDFLTGKEQRSPVWMQKLALEWVYRFASNPSRLWQRYVYGLPKLLLIVCKCLPELLFERGPVSRSDSRF